MHLLCPGHPSRLFPTCRFAELWMPGPRISPAPENTLLLPRRQ